MKSSVDKENIVGVFKYKIPAIHKAKITDDFEGHLRIFDSYLSMYLYFFLSFGIPVTRGLRNLLEIIKFIIKFAV